MKKISSGFLLIVLAAILLFAIGFSIVAMSAMQTIKSQMSSSISDGTNDSTGNDAIDSGSSGDIPEASAELWVNFSGLNYCFTPAEDVNILTFYESESYSYIWSLESNPNTDVPIKKENSNDYEAFLALSEELYVLKRDYAYQTSDFGYINDIEYCDGIIFAYREMLEDGTWSDEWHLVDGTNFMVYVHTGYDNWVDCSGGRIVDWEPYGTNHTYVKVVYDPATCINSPSGRIDLRAFKRVGVMPTLEMGE